MAHPRSRGENRTVLVCRKKVRGSSPLTRGKHRKVRNHDYPHGLIPAHAGKTSASLTPAPDPPAHPRSRGENSASMRLKATRQGSSPLTRGKPCAAGEGTGAGGLIPAHAGKTTSPPCSLLRSPAHPRSRGENDAGAEGAMTIVGSSPLTRGKRNHGTDCNHLRGLIPAHAGKTPPAEPADGGDTAHPRSRGENQVHRAVGERFGGSSPLTRGKRGVRVWLRGCGRLIPAHAGKTRTPGPAHPSTGAHPRSRGENTAPAST